MNYSFIAAGETLIAVGETEAQVVIDIPEGWDYEIDDSERLAGRLYVNLWDPKAIDEEEEDASE